MMDKLFHEVEDAFAVLQSGGVYRQVKLFYRYDGTECQLFARWGSGYTRLMAGHGTTIPKVRWLTLEIDGALLQSGRCGAPVLDMREYGLTKEPEHA